MSWPLYAGAVMLGLASGLHCGAMCGVIGGALCGGPSGTRFRRWNLLRVASYTGAGFLAGSGAQWFAAGAAIHPAFRAVWSVLQVAALAIAVVLLVAPDWAGWSVLAGRAGFQPWRAASTVSSPSMSQTDRWQPVHFFRASWTGLLWAGFPCGLLHAALLMAWMSGSAVDGAFILFLFGMGSASWLLAGSRVIGRLRHSARWTDRHLRRVAGWVLVLSWAAMAAGWGQGARHLAQAGLFCVPAL